MLPRHRLLRALKRLPVDRTPVWIMRQAGRYLPEYQRTRARAGDFLTLCKTPELACEVTLQPLARYDLDAAIIFSDILTIPDAMGLGLEFIENKGPCFRKPIRSVADIQQLPHLDPSVDLGYVMTAIGMVKRALADRVPLLGFSGSPWTLATYMVADGARDFGKTKALLYQHPQAFHHLLQTLTQNIIDYLLAQIAAGVDAVMLFDTWGGVLTPNDYQHVSLHYMAQIVKSVQQHTEVPVIIFCKGAHQHLTKIADTGCEGISLDWTCDIGQARAQVGDRVALQGNLDPSILLAGDTCIRAEVKRILTAYGSGPGHVFNLGHGITPQVDPEKLAVVIDAVKQQSPLFHEQENTVG
jgi:uroporphyrinogen decarboxylase